MSEPWQYQVRLYLTEDLAEVARADRAHPALRPLADILDKHGATLVNQFDAFAGYVAEAEKEGAEKFPLYKWTKAVIEDPAKRAKHLGTFTVHCAGEGVYSKAVADALEADLQPLVGGVVARLTKHDTNPANNPQAPPRYRQ